MRRRAAALLVLLPAVLPAAAPAVARRPPPALRAFASCDGLVSYARAHARQTGGRFGLGAPGAASPVGLTPPPGSGPTPEPATGGAEGSGTFSDTNVQEAGVDEPDVVKTDGRLIYTVAGGTFYAIDPNQGHPRIEGSVELGGYGHQIFVRDGRALVMWQAQTAGPGPVEGGPTAGVAFPGYAYPITVLAEIALGDPEHLRVLRGEEVSGAFVDARRHGDTARIVISSAPRAYASDRLARRAAGWLPAEHYANARTHKVWTRTAVGCRQVRRPRAFSGLETLTVLTVDLARGLPEVDADAIESDAGIVYASPSSLFLATTRWLDPADAESGLPAGVQTTIHRFDASEPGRTTYAASGGVPGVLLNSYSLSERAGVLRAASTTEPVWLPVPSGATEPSSPRQSYMTTLRQDGGVLGRVGQVGGLGQDERIYGVRYVDDVAYVVTFRQIDPLFTLDLSDATRPRVVGELSLEGYSAYLHPVSDGRLLGVGVDATPEGRRAGVRAVLFDVSDAAHPRVVDKQALGDASSSSGVEFDPHAFLWWPATQLAVLPLSGTFTGSVGLRVRPGGLSEAGRLSTDSSVLRDLVVGGRLYALTYAGVFGAALDDLSPLGSLEFPGSSGGGSPGPATR